MPRSQRQKPDQPSARPFPVADLDVAVSATWGEMKQALLGAIADGSMLDTVGQDHVDSLRDLLTDQEDVAKSLYRAGFQTALSIVLSGMELVMQTVPHDCGVPGHNHGAASTARVGRA